MRNKLFCHFFITATFLLFFLIPVFGEQTSQSSSPPENASSDQEELKDVSTEELESNELEKLVDSEKEISARSARTAATSSTGEPGAGILDFGAPPEAFLYTGSAISKVPINVPAGRGGISPTLLLIYNSSQKNGWVGQGWDLSLGSIVRSTRFGVDYTADEYMVKINSGQTELVNRSQTWGSGYYGAKTEEEFTKYFKNGDGWVSTTSDGKKYYFGSHVSSRQSNAHGVFKWCLDRVEDTNGNFMTIDYFKDQGEIYLDKIHYTGNGSFQPKHHIIFHRESRSDAAEMFESNDKVVTLFRLKTIDIIVDEPAPNTRVAAYGLSYTTQSTGRSLIEEITQFGSDAVLDTSGNITQGSHLPPVILNWQDSENLFNVSETAWLGENGGPNGSTTKDLGYQFIGDFNGDGKTDYMWKNDGWYVALSNGTSFDVPTKWLSTYGGPNGLKTQNQGYQLIGDFNGDGKADYMWNREGWHVALSNGNGFDTPTTWLETYGGPSGLKTHNKGKQFVADFNGDGKTDYIWYREGWHVALSNGNGFESPQKWLAPNGGPNGTVTHNSGYQFIKDFNGDGKADYMWNKNGWHVALSNGNGFDTPTTWLGKYEGPNGLKTHNEGYQLSGDFNGDGKADYMWNRNGWHVALSNGHGFDTPRTWLETYGGPNGLKTHNKGKQFISDFNGDGRADYLWNRGGWHVALSNGTDFDTPIKWLATYGGPNGLRTHNAGYEYLADFNGNGKTDFLWNYSGWHVATDSSPIPDLLSSIESPAGNRSEIEYQPSTAYQNTRLPFVIQTVSQITTHDGVGNSASTSFNYGQGLYIPEKRDFRGFGFASKTNPDGTIEKTNYHQEEFVKGRQYKTLFETPSGIILSKQEMIWELYPSNITDKKYAFVKLTHKRTDNYEGGNYAQESNEFDNANGNLISTTMSGTGAEDITTAFTYANFGDWVWRKTSKTLTGSISGMVRQTHYDYEYTTGNLLSKTFSLDGANDPFISFSYDIYGNLETQTDPRGGTTVMIYDTETQTLPVQVEAPQTNGVFHIQQTLEIDYRFGKPLVVQDENGNETAYSYDEFGRLTQIDLPNGGQAINQYFDAVYPRYTVSSIKEDNRGNWITTTTYMDGFNREIQMAALGNNNQYIVTRTYYDDMGRVYLSEGPFFSMDTAYPQQAPTDTPWSQTEFDYRGRPLSVSSPDSTHGTLTGTFSYNGLSTTTTDPDNASVIHTNDYLGRLVEVTKHTEQGDFVTGYSYNAAGDLLTVIDHQGNLTAMDYDTLGRKTEMSDPDMGDWSYTYDGNGNMIAQTDAKNQTVTFAYDELNRMVSKFYNTADPSVTYTYDNQTISNGIGRLYQVSNGVVTDTVNGYDALGNMLSKTREQAGLDQAYTTSYSYDVSGRPVTTTYPDGFSVTNAYIPGTGLLLSVTGSDSVVYAQMSGYTPEGKIGRIDHGNFTYTEYNYDNLSSRLCAIVTRRSGSASVLQDRHYTYTSAGDIAGITDNINATAYAYTYDRLHRLTSESGSGTPITYTYDAIGNITSKFYGGGTLDYSYDGSRPHAVDSINFNGMYYDYSYDANGNMTQGPNLSDPLQVGIRTVTYNADNMPVNVIHTNGSVTKTMSMVYDSSGARAVKQVEGGPTTYYLGGLFHVEDTGSGLETTRFVFAGNLRVAEIQNDTVTYFHKDHLGSSVVMTNDLGNQIEASEYLPYGGQRSHSGTEASNYKFTDHELDPESGLYNYSARLYDPFIGKFVTADTIVPDPANPQTLNRYSYCYNNPMAYVDPDGHSPSLVAIVVGAVIGAISSGAQSDWDPGAMISGAVIGGISGGVFAGVQGAASASLTSIVESEAITSTTAGIISGAAGGAAAGATAGGLSAAYYGGNVGQGILMGAGCGAIGGAAFGAIGFPNNPWKVAAYGGLGGGLSELGGGRFIDGALISSGLALMGYGYYKFTNGRYPTGQTSSGDAIGKPANPKAAMEVMKQKPNSPHMGVAVESKLSPEWGALGTEQALKWVPNNVPLFNDISYMHDFYGYRIFTNATVFKIVNYPTMIPAAAWTLGGSVAFHSQSAAAISLNLRRDW